MTSLLINHGADDIGLAMEIGRKVIIFDERPCKSKSYIYGKETYLVDLKTSIRVIDHVIQLVNPPQESKLSHEILWSKYVDGTFHLLRLAKEQNKPVTIVVNLTPQDRWLYKHIKYLSKQFQAKLLKYVDVATIMATLE